MSFEKCLSSQTVVISEIMSGENGTVPNPISGGTGTSLKKSIGRIIMQLNSEILELLEEYKKVKTDVPLSRKGKALEEAVKNKKDALKDALDSLEKRAGYVNQENLEKFIDMIKVNIVTAEKALTEGSDKGEEVENEATGARQTAEEAIEEIEVMEDMVQEEMRNVTNNLSSLAPVHDVEEEEREEDDLTRELRHIGKYQADRYSHMMKEIKDRMGFHRRNLLQKWKEQSDILDYQALKEIRSEFEVTHKKCRFQISEWERRKISDRLSDNLIDAIDQQYDEYMAEYRKMEEKKRTEAAMQRRRNSELEEYKREKRRAIPTWPQSLPYSKFKPDLNSWDSEHHLSSGSVKFGLLAEMLKSQGRLTTYEQIQIRLGQHRNDPNIISQVISLLDTINEETVYNKLSSAWDSVISLKKPKDQSLNEFFSKFETLQYSLNLADDAFQEPSQIEAGKDVEYYKSREKMVTRKVELNDKLKSVILIKALGIDGAFKTDILAKVNFNQEPEQVYEDTKTAVRDICGKLESETKKDDNTSDTGGEVKVHLVKPWEKKQFDSSRSRSGGRQENGNYRNNSWDRRGRDNFRGRDNSRGRDNFRERRSRSFSRDRESRNRSNDRSDSRGRSRRSSVSFQERRGGDSRRDLTPGPGMSSVIEIKEKYEIKGSWKIYDS